MDDSFEEWDDSRPFNVPEEIDLRHLKTNRTKDDDPPSIGGVVLAANGCTDPSNDPLMDVSALNSDDDMAVDANSQGRFKYDGSEGDEEETPTKEEEPKDAKNLEDQFNEICDKFLQDPTADSSLGKNVTMFRDGIRNARSAEKKVEEAFIATEKLLEKSKTTILESALPLYEYSTVLLEQLELEILAHFSESHHLRKSIMAKFDVLNKSWKQSHDDMMKRLVPGNQEAAMSTPTTEEGVEDDEAENKNEVDGSNELDWEEIISLSPALKDCVQKFLAGREQWASAVECFSKELDSADDKICKLQQHMLEILANAHRAIFENLAESQERLMRLFVENHVKRAALEEHLHRKASQQTKFFQRLMQSVKGPGQAKPVSSTNPESVDETKTRKTLTSIRNVFKREKGKKRTAESQDAPTDE